MARDRGRRNPKHRPPDGGPLRGRTMNTFVKIIRNGQMAPGKLADAELHFNRRRARWPEADRLRHLGAKGWNGPERHLPRASSPPTGSGAVSFCSAPSLIPLRRTA